MADRLMRAGEGAPTSTERGVSTAARTTLAGLSAAAGIVHLAMVPSHWDEAVAQGIGFAAVGWFQVVVAVLLLTRPTTLLLRVTVVANVAFIAVWVVSRTWGLPFGEHAWHPHNAAFVDLACVGIEAALVVTAAAVLHRPALGRRVDDALSARRVVFAAVVPVSAVALATVALASPSARNHAEAAHGTHVQHASTATAAAAATVAGDGHGHSHGTGTAKNAAKTGDKGLSALQNGHQHARGQVKLDNETKAALSIQLAQTAKLVERYPNIAAAEAAGWRRAGPFSPGLGTHYTRYSLTGAADEMIMGVDGPMWPTLIFDGIGPDAPIAGFMYMARGSGAGEPEGFVGPNDHWHYHTNVCITMRDGKIEAPLGADMPSVSQELCSKYGGRLITNTGYMVHVWTVPGYESPRGIFSEINPKLKCPDGTYYRIPREEVGFRTSVCLNP